MKRLPFVILLAILIGCDDDNNISPGETIFTFSVPNEGVFPGYDYWIILHDNESGELIDSKQITVGAEPTSFTTDKAISDNLIITYIRYDDPFDVRIWVYNEVPVGKTWSASYPFESGVAVERTQQEHSFVINNVPSMYGFAMSDLFGWNGEDPAWHHDGQITGFFNFRKGGVKQMMVVDDGTINPKYSFIDNPTSGDVTIDYNTMTAFDKYLDISFPEMSSPEIEVRVEAYDPDQNPVNSYLFYEWFGGGFYEKRNSVKLGLLNEIEFYKAKMKFGYFNFESMGAAPSKVDYIDKDNFSFDQTIPTNFSLTTLLDYTYARSLYLYSTDDGNGIFTSYQLLYHTTPSSPKQIDTLTPELKDKLEVSMQRFPLTNIDIHFWKGRNYMEAISFGFDPEYDYAKPVEHSWVSLWHSNF